MVIPVINSISTNAGLEHNIIRIIGAGFSSSPRDNTVTLQELDGNTLDCQVLSSTYSTIDCELKTSSKSEGVTVARDGGKRLLGGTSPNMVGFHAGAKVELYSTTDLNAARSGTATLISTTSLLSLEMIEATPNTVAKISGFLVAPNTGNYNFMITSTNDAEFWFSNAEGTSNPSNLQKTASSSKTPFRLYWTQSEQISDQVNLYGGSQYYFEAYVLFLGTSDYFSIGMLGEGQGNANYLTQPEVQKIAISYTPVDAIDQVTITATSGTFTLNYNNTEGKLLTTIPIAYNAENAEVQIALSKIGIMATVTKVVN